MSIAQPALLENPNLPEPAVRLLLLIAVLGWNLALFPAGRRSEVEEDLLKAFTFSSPEEREALVSSLRSFAEVKMERFPDDRRLVVRHTLEYRGPGNAHYLQVYSTPLPE